MVTVSPVSYSTISAPSEGIYKEKGSKFLAFALPVTTEVEVKERIKRFRKQYFDARHQGYAYVLGPGKEKFRAFDDGEPNHSTGDPILGQIRARNLTNILIIVVRYFGGIKLGVGGLVSAYKAAAEQALMHAVIVEKEVLVEFDIRYSYDATPHVMRLVKEFGLGILQQEFKESGYMKVRAAKRVYNQCLKKLRLLQAMGVKLNVDI